MSHSKDLAGMGFESGSLAPKSILSSLHSTAWQLQRYYKKEAWRADGGGGGQSDFIQSVCQSVSSCL